MQKVDAAVQDAALIQASEDATTSPPGRWNDAGAVVDAGATADAGSTPDAAQASASDGGLPRECANPPAPVIDPRLLGVCPGCAGGARCVPRALVESKAPDLVKRLAECDDSSVCIPDAIITSMGFYAPASCRSLNAAEGRCLSECLPDVASQRDILPQDSCATYERCVPCYDPIQGEPTGACSMTCDTGPREPAQPLERCCGEAGVCLPGALIPQAQQGLLSADSCSDASALCAPLLLTDPQARPAVCTSLANAEGRCLPSCLPPVAAQANLLPQAECAQGELCAPCFNPLDGSATGICSLHGDAPTQPPVRFDQACCGSSGLCIPSALAGAQAKLLPADSCASELGQGWLCAPKRIVADPSSASNPFASCKLDLGLFKAGHGKCVPGCMVAAQGWTSRLLQRSSCDSGEVCVPCSLAKIPGC